MLWPFRKRPLARLAQQGAIPLAWATAPDGHNYLNLGDALSPIMVTLVTGKPTRLVSIRSPQARMAAVGTIGHSFAGGEIWFWGTGSSRYLNAGEPGKERIPFKRAPNTTYNLCATRGPVSRAILSEGAEAPAPTYGDPVWLLPRFYRPKVEKKWELGVIIHLADLQDRAFEAHPKAHHHRYAVSDDEKSSVKLINTVTDVSIDAMRERLDDILACKRIVSTSLHGMVIAEAYGIPCLYFSPRGAEPGLTTIPLDPDGDLDLRITDLYLGIGESKIAAYNQPRNKRTQWEDVFKAIDASWTPKTFDEDALIGASPLEPSLVQTPANGTVFDLPVIRSSQLQHNGAFGAAKR